MQIETVLHLTCKYHSHWRYRKWNAVANSISYYNFCAHRIQVGIQMSLVSQKVMLPQTKSTSFSRSTIRPMKGLLLYNDGRNILSLQCLNTLQTKIIEPILNHYYKEDQATLPCVNVCRDHCKVMPAL